MKNTNVLPYILRLLRNAAILEVVILIIVAVIGYLAKFNSYATYGNFMFLAGILVLIVAGLSASGGVRQGIWANSMFLSLQRIVVQDDLSDANSEGVPGFFRTWGFPLFVALAALITILLGILITTIYPA
jgi:hypothetical protein